MKKFNFLSQNGVIRKSIIAIGCMGMLFFPLRSILSYHRSHTKPDTRTQAKDWIQANLKQYSAIATGPFGMRFQGSQFRTVLIPFSPTGSEALAPFYDTRWYEDLDLLIASDYDYARFAKEPDRFKPLLKYYDDLREEWALASEFIPATDQNGPKLWLYRPPTNHSKEVFDGDLFEKLSIIAETTMVVNFTERLAFALYSKGKLAKTEQLMNAAITLQPRNPQLLNSLAWTLFNNNKFDAALTLTERSLGVNLNQAEIIGLSGSILMRLQKMGEAEEKLQRALKMNNNLEVPYLDLELLYRLQNRRDKQIETLTRYLSILPPQSDNAKRTVEYLRQLKGQP